MRLICKKTILIVTVGALATLLCSTGCRSQGSAPKLADLAWWKKDDMRLASTPPPPASHFNPEPTVEMLADNSQNASDIAPTNDERVATQNKDNASLAASPIRKPYRYEGAQDNDLSINSANAQTGNLKTSLPDWNPPPSENASLSAVQRDLADSLSNRTKPIPKVGSVANSNPGNSNDFAQGWRNDFALPTENSASSINKNIASDIDTAANALKQSNNDFSKYATDLENQVNQQAVDIQKSAKDLQQSANQFAGTINQEVESGTQHLSTLVSPNSTTQPDARFASTQPLYPQFDTGGLPDNSLRASNPQVPFSGDESGHPSRTTSYPSTPFAAYSTDNKSQKVDAMRPGTRQNHEQVGYNSATAGNTNVVNASGMSSTGSTPPAIDSIVPASIVHGSGSFAPGSVSPLIPISK